MRGLNFHVEGLKIEVGANNWSGGLTPPPPHFKHWLWLTNIVIPQDLQCFLPSSLASLITSERLLSSRHYINFANASAFFSAFGGSLPSIGENTSWSFCTQHGTRVFTNTYHYAEDTTKINVWNYSVTKCLPTHSTLIYHVSPLATRSQELTLSINSFSSVIRYWHVLHTEIKPRITNVKLWPASALLKC